MNFLRIGLSVIVLLTVLSTTGCKEDFVYFEDYPYLENETIGMFNYVHDVAITRSDKFPTYYWGDDSIVIPAEMGGESGLLRYMLAFSAYGVAAAAENTPAYRKPYVEAIEGLIEKMLDPQVWTYWLDEADTWGGENPIHPYNIMYTGHLQLMMALHERVAGNQKYFSDVHLVGETETWTTNLYDLSADIHNLILTNEDAAGNKYYNVSCETPNVFIPCNSIPQLAFAMLNPSVGLDSASVYEPWRDWITENMLNAETANFYFRFWPFEETPYVQAEIRGGYSSWSWSFIYGIDPEWVQDIYPTFRETTFDWDSNNSERAFIRFFEPGVTDKIWDMQSTAHGALLAKQVGDQEGFEALLAGYGKLVGVTHGWFDGHTKYGYYYLPIMHLMPTSLILPAMAFNEKVTFNTMTESPRGADFYKTPYLADVTNSKIFVNQAIWDDSVLYITINGDEATTASTNLVIRNLDPTKTYEVLLDGETYENWTRSSDLTGMTITSKSTSKLLNLLRGIKTQRFQIIES